MFPIPSRSTTVRRLQLEEPIVACTCRSKDGVQRVVMGVDDVEKPQAAGHGAAAKGEAPLQSGFVAIQQVIEQRCAIVPRELNALVTHPEREGSHRSSLLLSGQYR